jgi:murein DD-endopeptidase MepM/ murein hydrolase activator NlpD
MHVYSNVPFKKGGRITDDFTKAHKARDVAPRNDDDGQVFAIEGGTVTDTQDGMSQGDSSSNMVIVRGSDQALTVYAHVSPSVSANMPVKKGTKIGTVDMSGDSTGLHVHLARLPAGDGTVDDVLDRQDKGVFYQFKSLGSW